MKCMRRRLLMVLKPSHTQSASYTTTAVAVQYLTNLKHLPEAGDIFDNFHDDLDSEEHPIPGDQPLPSNRARYDWRTRATSRRRPGGLIDPPSDGSKEYHPQRYGESVLPLLPGSPWFTEVRSYEYRFVDLLKAEEENERSLIRTRLANWSLGKLQRDGYCLTGLSAFWLRSKEFGKPVAAFSLGPGIALPYHRFENGTQVLLSRLDPLTESLGQGSIICSSETELRITFDEKLDLKDTWRLDLFNTDIAYRRMRAAIQQLSHDPEKQEHASTEHSQPILQGTYLRNVLLSSFTPPGNTPLPETCPSKREGVFAQDQLIASWARRYAVKSQPVIIEGDPDLSCLNATQRRAVAMMVGERISLVQGPPGTGKTKTIIEAVKLLKMHFQVPHPLLVCTYTNVAVDNLVEGLSASGMCPLRVAFSAKVKPELLPHTLDAQMEVHPMRPKLKEIEDNIERLCKHMENARTKMQGLKLSSTEATLLRRRLQRMESHHDSMKRKLWAVRNEMVRDIVSRADVICTTCITSASSSLRVTDFPVVFLDEASMSTEPASLIPLMKGCRHLALIGDHKQLPPVITSHEAAAGGLGVSLFERLTEEGNTPSIMLDTQYRMHPSLSHFPSCEFYNFSLQNGVTNAATLLPPASSHLGPDPKTGNRPSVIFLDHAGNEEMKDRSRVNHNEAKIVCAVIEDLLLNNPTMKGNDIGIIAPYAAQISLLHRLLTSNKKYEEHLVRQLGRLRAMQVANIEVKTVDGFEGREKEVIIFSTVRNNRGGHIGFLADRRRMNVGLTRAKRGLFVVGSVGTLRTGKVGVDIGKRGKEEREVWRRYVEWLAMNGAVRTLQGEELRGMLDPETAAMRTLEAV